MAVVDDLSHLQLAYRPHALLAEEDRLQWIGQDRWINYAHADRVLARLTELLFFPPRNRMPCLLLFGATGMGKTHIIEKFRRDHRSSFDEPSGRTRQPVAYLQMPPAPNEKDFYEELLLGLGTALPSGLSVTSLRHRARILARQLEVRMLVIDEIHSMLAGTFREQRILLNALRRAQQIDLGFNPTHLLNLTVDPHEAGYNQAQGLEFYENLLRRVRGLSGVRSASVAFTYPSNGATDYSPVYVEGHPPRPGEAAPTILVNRVSSGCFETLEIPILSGRALRGSDSATAPPVAVISQTMAQQLWPNQDALGRRFRMNSESEPLREVVGIAQDCKYLNLLGKAVPYFYVPLAQHYVSFANLLVRTEAAPESMIGSVQEQVHGLVPILPIINVQTMEQALNSGLAGFYAFHLGANLAAALGILGLVLALVGVYGVISYSTSQRTHEIGIRMALGARPDDIWGVVLPQGLAIVAFGAVIGILAALGLTRVMAGFLYGISEHDPLTYMGVTAMIAAVTLVVCYIPARRATKVDPMVALRYE